MIWIRSGAVLRGTEAAIPPNPFLGPLRPVLDGLPAAHYRPTDLWNRDQPLIRYEVEDMPRRAERMSGISLDQRRRRPPTPPGATS